MSDPMIMFLRPFGPLRQSVSQQFRFLLLKAIPFKSTQKPQIMVIWTLRVLYEADNANLQRG